MVAVAAVAAAAVEEEMVFVPYTAFGAPLREGVRGGESRLLGSLHGALQTSRQMQSNGRPRLRPSFSSELEPPALDT